MPGQSSISAYLKTNNHKLENKNSLSLLTCQGTFTVKQVQKATSHLVQFPDQDRSVLGLKRILESDLGIREKCMRILLNGKCLCDEHQLQENENPLSLVIIDGSE